MLACDFCGQMYTSLEAIRRHVRRQHLLAHACQACAARFESAKGLQRHRLTCLPASCPQCQQSFPSAAAVERHVRSTHEARFVCRFCGKRFALRTKLTDHERSHTNERPFEARCARTSREESLSCDVCLKTFASVKGLRSHRVTHFDELKKFVCRICKAAFHARHNLASHHLVHTGEKAFRCEECGAPFTRRSSLKAHVSFKHSKELASHVCPECGKRFPQTSHLKRHLLTHTGERSHLCDLCGKSFSQVAHLHTHKRLRHKVLPYEGDVDKEEKEAAVQPAEADRLEALDALTCDACFKPFHTLPDLKRHLRSHAKRITKRPTPCPYCRQRFALRCVERRVHIERCHPPRFKCDDCEYVARSLGDLEEHFKAQHAVQVRVRREFFCDLCPGRKAYLKRRSMREHFQRRHLKLNVCQHCGRAHGSPAALLVHERLHTGERPYVCEMCGRAYHNASSLNMHKHSYHRGDASRRAPQDRLVCQLCQERFLTLEAVREHLESVHGVMRGDSARERGFECEVCHKRFTALQTMRDHMLLHRGERPHECHICNKRFTTRSVRNKHVLVVHQGIDERRFACSACGKRFVNRHKLTVHERLHTGERPFTCEVCGKTYTNASRVKEHKMAVHKIMPYKCDKCPKEFKVGSELRLHQLVHAQLPQPPAPQPPQPVQM
ncbi:Hypothetical predicted protein [Cloeon dipterum]|uniref:C2H2-type domain-containing protein n=1 Tax=Cloeon dipterum TaxID=197152 RepID=A0A8S1DQC0_9INSE|nr:Hypothetical predicted protein [Cloeon dipterum]